MKNAMVTSWKYLYFSYFCGVYKFYIYNHTKIFTELKSVQRRRIKLNDDSIESSNETCSKYEDSSSHNLDREKFSNSEHLQLNSNDSLDQSEIKISERVPNNDMSTSEAEAESIESNNDSDTETNPTSFSFNKSIRSRFESDSPEQSFENLEDKSQSKFLTPKKKFFVKEKKSTSNIVDLTINDSLYDPSMNKEVKVVNNKQRIDTDDVIVCSSTSTSGNTYDFNIYRMMNYNQYKFHILETEMDKEVVNLAKKEIGVGNIDPIDAQKKEHLLLNIEHIQKQLDKLNVIFLQYS